MKKLNTVLSNDQSLHALTHQVEQKLLIQQWWQSVLPPELLHHCSASHIKDNTLFIIAGNAAVATKIKFLHASLLNKLENSQKTHKNLSNCKVTAIKVKVQVKSTPTKKAKRVPSLNTTNASHLLALSQTLAGSELAHVLTRLAKKSKK